MEISLTPEELIRVMFLIERCLPLNIDYFEIILISARIGKSKLLQTIGEIEQRAEARAKTKRGAGKPQKK